MTASRTRFDTSVNYYQVLNVAPGATAEDITRAYRALMRVNHPDFYQESLARAKAEERAKLINAAYAVLSRPDARKAYDAQMRPRAVSDTLMQRYTGAAPGRADPMGARPRPRPPSRAATRARRRAYRSAVRQLMLMAATFALIIMLLVVAFGLTGAAWDAISDGFFTINW